MYGTIRVDLPATRDKGYLTGVHGLGKVLWGKFCLVFSLKEKKLSSNCRSSKYVSVRESWTGPIESRDVGKAEIHNFDTCK